MNASKAIFFISNSVILEEDSCSHGFSCFSNCVTNGTQLQILIEFCLGGQNTNRHFKFLSAKRIVGDMFHLLYYFNPIFDAIILENLEL
jgi:hypothetical protein